MLELPQTEHNSEILTIAFEAAKAGGEIVAQYFERGTDMRAKEEGATYNLVTDADIQSEKAIAALISAAFPEHAILGEEENAGDVHAEHVWIVDPLDGTNNFAHRIPHFAVSIGYFHQGKPKCGVVLNPVRGDWYWALAGQGAFHNGRRLKVGQASSLDQAMVGCGFYYDRGAMMEATLNCIQELFKANIHGIRRFGTAALDFCQVADGQFGAFFEYQLNPWDFAAGLLIVEEAGGKVTDGLGQPIELRPTSALVSNDVLHESCLAIVRKHHPA